MKPIQVRVTISVRIDIAACLAALAILVNIAL